MSPTRCAASASAIALDDFGTGYSCLAFLDRLPLDELKIDRQFVDRLGKSDAGAAVVSTILRLAQTFGLRAVAEGIETEAQLQALLDLGCEFGQGFHFSRPIPTDRVGGLLAGQLARAGGSSTAAPYFARRWRRCRHVPDVDQRVEPVRDSIGMRGRGLDPQRQPPGRASVGGELGGGHATTPAVQRRQNPQQRVVGGVAELDRERQLGRACVQL